MANQLFNFGPPIDQLNTLQRYFEAPRWRGRFEWIGLMGHGSYGVCVRVRQHFADPDNPQGPPRDFILKRANTRPHEENLRHEIDRLMQVAGGLHIVRPIVLERNPFFDFDAEPANQFIHPDRRAQVRDRYHQNGFMLGPALLLEPLENGTLYQFQEKREARNLKFLPNRLLWRFFLCLVRACIAMASPRPFQKQTPPVLEDMDFGQQPSEFTHTDLHGGNVLMGDFDAAVPEHQFTPILKLIDFGIWEAGARYNWLYSSYGQNGPPENIFQIGKLMLELITGLPYERLLAPVPVQPGNFMTRAVQIVNMERDQGPHGVDPDLSLLVVNCMADERDRRPDLEDLFDQVSQGIQRPASYYDDPQRESDQNITQLESDQNITQLIHRVLHQPPPP